VIDFDDIHRRTVAASPLTRPVLRGANAWMVVMAVIVMAAHVVATHVGTGRGVVVHPPIVVTVLAHHLAVLAGLGVLYAWLHFGGPLCRFTVAIVLL
jgi:hypothetical protein